MMSQRLNSIISVGKLEMMIGFNVPEFKDLVRRCRGFWHIHRSRGPTPKLSLVDHLLLYDSWLKLGSKLAVHAATFKITMPTCDHALDRIRPVLLDAMKSEWWKTRPRPKPLTQSSHPFIALLVDSTTIEVNQPHASAATPTKYFDGKNWIYGMKKEVAVMATEPYYAMFAFEGKPGSIHDYKIFKSGYTRYLEYLVKTPSEKEMLTDPDARWAILGDNGYFGPDGDTPELRRIAIPKRDTNEPLRLELTRLRVHVERFFGRLHQLWAICRNVYRFSHDHFDTDMDSKNGLLVCFFYFLVASQNKRILCHHQLGWNNSKFRVHCT
jgi:hypothetical protein